MTFFENDVGVETVGGGGTIPFINFDTNFSK